jgi:hypothetical protein
MRNAANGKEEDYAALIYQESQRRKAEAAALAAAVGKNKKKPSTSKNGTVRRTSSPRISQLQLLGMAHLRRGLKDGVKQLQLRGSENRPQTFIMVMVMTELQRKLLESSTERYVPQMDARIKLRKEECALP